jgi:hypothetical protein
MTDPDVTNQSQLARRARQYWNADGIPTLFAAGLYLAVVGSLLLVAVPLRHGHDPNIPWYIKDMVAVPLTFAMMVSPVGIIFVLIWVATNWEWWIEQVKLRITYPRTGYVAPPSRWRSNAPTEAVVRKGFLYGLLDFLGGFWFWLLIALFFDTTLLSYRPATTLHALMLAVLLAVRGLRFGLYPEKPTEANRPARSSFVRIGVLLQSVLNSFWVWVLLVGFLPSLPTRAAITAQCLGVLALAIVVVKTLASSDGSVTKAGVVTCAPLCVFLFWQNTFATIAVALLLPGLYAAGVGAFRLVRYLRANPMVAA